MWFYTENNSIISGPVPLPKIWVKEDVQYPLKELEKKGHIIDLNNLGWLKQEKDTTIPTPYQNVQRYSHTIVDNKIVSVPVFIDKVITEKRKIKLKEIRTKGYELIDSVSGKTERDRIMLIAKGLSLLDAQTGRGGGRDPRQDVLRPIFEYVSQVHTVIEQAENDLTTNNNPENYNVVWPV